MERGIFAALKIKPSESLERDPDSVVYSHSKDSFYKGQTKDQSNRMTKHNAGLVKSTKYGIPWILVWHTLKKSVRVSNKQGLWD